MDPLLTWLANNPWAISLILVLLSVIVLSVVSMFAVAFVQKREVSFWPPKIGPGPQKGEVGQVISRNDRSKYSQAFAKSSLRSVDIFAGDTRSWLQVDMPVYADLRRRGVRVRILVDEPNPAVIQAGKAYGIEFRRYANNMTAPLKATITDVDDETECRALVVRRRTPRAGLGGPEQYEYIMKWYHGSSDFPAIRAMALLFDQLFSGGAEL